MIIKLSSSHPNRHRDQEATIHLRPNQRRNNISKAMDNNRMLHWLGRHMHTHRLLLMGICMEMVMVVVPQVVRLLIPPLHCNVRVQRNRMAVAILPHTPSLLSLHNPSLTVPVARHILIPVVCQASLSRLRVHRVPRPTSCYTSIWMVVVVRSKLNSPLISVRIHPCRWRVRWSAH